MFIDKIYHPSKNYQFYYEVLQDIIDKHLAHFDQADPDYGNGVRKALEVECHKDAA